MANATTQLYAIQIGKLYYPFRAKTDLYKNIIGLTGVFDPSGSATASALTLQPKTPLRVLAATGLLVPFKATTANGKKYRVYCSSEKVATGHGAVLDKEILGSKVTNIGIRQRRYIK